MTNYDSIRWGILGTGWVAAQFARDLQRVPGASLAAVASRSAEKAEHFAKTMGAWQSFGDYRDLVQSADVDIVYVATPHTRHYEDCLLALEMGKPVLCEKPFTMNRSQAQKIFEIAQSKNLFCMEAMWMRFIPLIQEVRRRIQQGEIGTVRLFSADFGYPEPFAADSRFFKQDLGGGALLDRGCYPLSLAVFLLGKPELVSGFAHIGTTGVDEQSSLLLKYDNGALATLSSTLQTYGTNTATIAGTRGKIVIEAPFYYPTKISISRFSDTTEMKARPQMALPIGWKEQLKANLKANAWVKRLKILRPKTGSSIGQIEGGNGYQYQAMEVGRCLREGLLESPWMPWAETLQVLEIMDSLRADWQLRYSQDDN